MVLLLLPDMRCFWFPDEWLLRSPLPHALGHAPVPYGCARAPGEGFRFSDRQNLPCGAALMVRYLHLRSRASGWGYAFLPLFLPPGGLRLGARFFFVPIGVLVLFRLPECSLLQ